MRTTALFSAALFAGLPIAAGAQLPVTQPTPAIVALGQGEVKVSPDRATILASVETRDRTAALAGAGNATTQTRVIAALRALGLESDQISTVGYSVQPEYKYDPNGGGRPQIVGYVARNTVRAELRRIDQVGKAIDAALGAGANRIAGVSFYASNQEEARRTALATAVANACRDAETMARAAGGSVGGPLEIMAQDYGFPQPRPMMEMADMRAASAPAPETPIEAADITVRVSVMTRWAFSAGQAASGVRCGQR